MNNDPRIARMHSGKLYCCQDEELYARQDRAQELVYDYNHSRPSQRTLRQELLHQMFAQVGEDCFIEPPFHANWGGMFVRLGHRVYANFGLTLVDDGPITIGDDVMIGPGVTLCTGTHPLDPDLRRQQLQYTKPICIGSGAWLGGHVFVMPGVTIGENAVIGAGSVVTGDIPANVVAVGNPCRVLRPVTDRDRLYYDRDKPVDLAPLEV